jgi:hypothetical protein
MACRFSETVMMKARTTEMQSDQDEQVFGGALYEVVRSDTSDPREWLQEAPVSRLLKTHHNNDS